MKAYNLYYENKKINSKPLSRNDIDMLNNQKYVNKKINDSTVQKYLMKDIRIVECIIV